MELFLAISIVIFGAIIGSFLNVVILRYNTGMSVQGRSLCFSCGKTLRWYELIPVLSFVAQAGKCRGCKSPISWQYPAVELLTGVVFLLMFYRIAGELEMVLMNPLLILPILFYGIIFSLLIAITVYDLRHTIIPDGLVYTFIALSFIQQFIVWQPSLSFVVPEWIDLLAGPILFLPFFAIWFFSKGMWMGLGDGKLALGIGWFLGMTYGFSAIVFAFWIGAAVSILLYAGSKLGKISIGSKKLTMKSEIPFAPFLIFALVLVYLTHVDVLSFTGSIQELITATQ